MKTYLALLVVFFTAASLCGVLVETESLEKFMYGEASGTDYDNWLSHVVEGVADPGYNVYAPYDRQTEGFGAYHHPTNLELQNWGLIVENILDGDLDGAEQIITAADFPYEIVELHETSTGRDYVLLREVVDLSYYDDNGTSETYDDEDGAFDWGWGLYVFNLDPDAKPIIVTTPHINDDYPTVPISCQSFLQWNARFWLVSSVGREVWWNDDGHGYTNSKSLCDPTRREEHAFNVTYQRMCDDIRDETDEREVCVQLHSYDWSSHQGYATCQIAAGRWSRSYPTLPIRDFSPHHEDFINFTPWIVHPANSIGVHDDVTVNDFYAVWYEQEPYYHYHDGDSTAVSNNIDLPGYESNRQLVYSMQGLNVYDAREPFYHVEFDELPWIYEHSQQNWWWMSGWDTAAQRWRMGHLFDRYLAYYKPWVDAMELALDAYLEFDDNETPATPQNFSVYSVQNNTVSLQWDKSDSFDFDTYRIRYSDEPIVNGNYQTRDRDNSNLLASLATELIDIPGLDNNTQYWFDIQAIDANGNESPFSEEITCFTGPARINNFVAQGMSDYNYLKWVGQSQTDCLGFVVERTTDDPNGVYETIASYVDHDSLQGAGANAVQYIYNDFAVGRDTTYYYKVSPVWDDGTVARNNFYEAACPQTIYELVIRNADGSISESARFAINRFSSDGYDTPYDILHGAFNQSGDYINAAFYEGNWNNSLRWLYQESYAEYDLDTELKTWRLLVRTNQTGTPLFAELREVSTNGERNGEKLYLQAGSTWHDIANDGPLQFSVNDNDWYNFYIHWGDLQPDVTVSNRANRYYSEGDDITFNWSTPLRVVVDHFELFATNGADSVDIVAALPNNATSYDWQCPDMLLNDMQLVVRAYFEDGSYTDYASDYRFGCFPSDMDVVLDPGWQLRTNPYSHPDITWSAAEPIELWSYLGDDKYEEAESFLFGKAYWLYSENEFTISNLTFQQIREEAEILPLEKGWNLVPNLFMEELATKDQNFVYAGQTFTFAEAVQHGLVSRAAYVYDEGYRNTYVVQPEESYWLYSFVDGLEINCIPFADNPGYEFFRDGWMFELIASQGGADTGRLTVGTNRFSTDGFDPLYDLPKPPAKPDSEAIELYVVESHQFSPYPDSLFHQDFGPPLSDNSDEPNVWPVLLRVSNLDPVTFEAVRTQFPQDYGVTLLLDGVSYSLSYDDTFEFIPEDSLTYGYLQVWDHQVGVDDDVTAYSPNLHNWPNPFNPETTISFSLASPAKTKLTVYNVRGQRVRTLVNNHLDAGEHRIVWNGVDNAGRQVGTGVYFYRLEAGDIERTQKMLLIK